MTIEKKPSCEPVYPDCSKYQGRDWDKEGCPCCGAEIKQWGVFDKYSDEGFTGLQCTKCKWECVD